MSGISEEAIVKPEVDPLSTEATNTCTLPGGFAPGGATGPGGFAQGTDALGGFAPGTGAEASPNPVVEDAATMNQEEETVAPVVVAEVKPPKPEEDLGEPIHEPHEDDILNGRGASVNAHRGNTKFRALCFARKPEFEAGNHAAKRRIATEIVNQTQPGRFLKRKQDKGPWYELSKQKAILKACQVMRDFQRPDRLALREMAAANGARKRQRTTESTPGVNAPLPVVPLDPIVENPFGVHDHDVLSGRGAFVNGHIGNQRFRELAISRKPQFDVGTYADKRALATEIVGIVRSLDPPGRFLKRITGPRPAEEDVAASGIEGDWEELSDDRAIHKACQVMRDLNRPDRTGDKKGRKGKAQGEEKAEEQEAPAPAVVDIVLATEEVLDRALPETSHGMSVPPAAMEEPKGIQV